MKHLFLALSTKGFGETTLGLRVAQELQHAGDDCVFLVHSSAVGLLSRTPFPHMKTADHTLGLLKVMLMTLLDRHQPTSIILSDYFTTALAFERAELDPAYLIETGLPLGAIDTWDMEKSGTAIDAFGGEHRTFQDWSHLLDYRLIPVPIANPRVGGPYYCNLPEPAEITQKVRRHVRRGLGIGDDERAILFCTAEWQHARFRNEAGNQLAKTLPHLIAHYMDQLGQRVHLVHVGPAAYPLESLGSRYHWLPPLPPDKFETLLASLELLMVANASSTTIAKALVSGIPSVALMNSHSLQAGEDPPAIRSGLSERLAGWVRSSTPLYPFTMWPIGYYRFLKPSLDGNPYCDVVPMLEILHESETLDEMRSLLWDAQARQRRIDAQMAYVDGLKRLPSGAGLVGRMVGR
jgi:hypothetical protein